LGRIEVLLASGVIGPNGANPVQRRIVGVMEYLFKTTLLCIDIGSMDFLKPEQEKGSGLVDLAVPGWLL
jgi:hypothetical protein